MLNNRSHTHVLQPTGPSAICLLYYSKVILCKAKLIHVDRWIQKHASKFQAHPQASLHLCMHRHTTCAYIMCTNPETPHVHIPHAHTPHVCMHTDVPHAYTSHAHPPFPCTHTTRMDTRHMLLLSSYFSF